MKDLITLQHVRIDGESCVSVEQDGELVWVFDLNHAKPSRLRYFEGGKLIHSGQAPDLLLTAFLRTL